jgi:hypothetical protein
MKLMCVFGRHQPSTASVARREGSLVGLCDDCARPLERQGNGRWAALPPIYERPSREAA